MTKFFDLQRFKTIEIGSSVVNSVVSGTSGNDSIRNYYASMITIQAGAGRDTVYNSNSQLTKTYLGDGNDSIENWSSNNGEIYGEAGNDYIDNSDSVNMTISGGDGNDAVYNYGGDNSTITGGAGNDTIRDYSSDNVTISGDAGNDYIYRSGSSSGKNILITGGAGKDSIQTYYGSNITIDGGDGDDEIDADYGTNVTIYGGAGNDYITYYADSDNKNNLATIYGGVGNDTIRLSGYDATHKAVIQYADGDGNDYITGFSKTDTLKIATTKTFFTVKSGDDLLFTFSDGGSIILEDVGNNFSSKNLVTVTGGDSGGGSSSGGGGSNTEISVKNGVVTATNKFTGSKINLADYSGATKVNASAVTKNITIVGNAKKNTLRGGSGNDTLTGKGGADLFIFGAGNDTITDYVSGTDKISISGSYSGEVAGSNVILTTSKGTLTVKGMANKNLTINGKTKKYSSGGSLPTGLSYNSDKTVLTVGNNFTGDTIDLSKYASVYDVDAHKCKRMNLTITGNNFNNSLVGGGGSDTIFGGNGNDTLTGGAGKDIFVHSTGDDVITDYTAGKDKIKLKNTQIKDISVGNNNIVFTTSTGNLTIKNGAGKSVTIIDSSGKETTQRYSANLSEIIAEKSVGEFENYTEKLTQENLITFAE